MHALLLQEQLREEVLDMARKMAAAELQLLCIDTESKFISTGFAKEVAVSASYFFLVLHYRGAAQLLRSWRPVQALLGVGMRWAGKLAAFPPLTTLLCCRMQLGGGTTTSLMLLRRPLPRQPLEPWLMQRPCEAGSWPGS